MLDDTDPKEPAANPWREASPVSRPTVGVIRWDAYYGTGYATQAMERSLSPAKYHHRAPFFARVEGPDQLRINGDSDEVMAREIDYAVTAGVYWAFLNYAWECHRDSDLSRPLRRFLRHPDRERVPFTFILTNRSLMDDDQWTNHYRAALQEACAWPNFQTTPDGRPLLFTFATIKPKALHDPAARDRVKARLDEVRALVAGQTGREPYLVHFMHEFRTDAWPAIRELGCDASTLYAHFPPKTLTFGEFHDQIARNWPAWTAVGPHVPLLSSGWDNRPRYDNPVPWIPKTEDMLVRWVHEPTPEELAAHVTAGMDFVHAHPDACPARSLMFYAWNEHDEGGWLNPTLNPDTGKPDDRRVRAVGDALRNWRPSAKRKPA